MPVKSYIFIIPCSAVFNLETVPKFETFSEMDSSFLYSSLYENHLEVTSNLRSVHSETICCFDAQDENLLPERYMAQKEKSHFIDTEQCWAHMESVIARRMEAEQANILLLFSNTIGITPSCIHHVLNLLNHEDNTIVAGKSGGGMISFIGFNHFNRELLRELKGCRIDYFDFLSHINRFENYLYTINSSLHIDNLQSFRELYRILSRRESIEFCSHEMHEKFTHLFIEYRELLK